MCVTRISSSRLQRASVVAHEIFFTGTTMVNGLFPYPHEEMWPLNRRNYSMRFHTNRQCTFPSINLFKTRLRINRGPLVGDHRSAVHNVNIQRGVHN